MREGSQDLRAKTRGCIDMVSWRPQPSDSEGLFRLTWAAYSPIKWASPLDTQFIVFPLKTGTIRRLGL